MPQKTKIILIVTIIFVLGILIGVYFYLSSKNTTTTDSNPSLLQKFNPFGTSAKNTTNTNKNTGTGDTGTSGITKANSRFYQITNFAIAGAAFLEDMRSLPVSNDATAPTSELAPSIRYVERSTGHIYQMYLDTKKSGTISNSTIPGVYEAIFNNRATSTIYRYVSTDDKTITSFLASLGGDSSFLPVDITAISLSPNKTQFFSIIKNVNGVTGTTNSFDETKTTQVFTSAFSEWLPQWVTDKNIYLTTKPSYLAPGGVYILNITNGTLSKIFGGIDGLTTLADNDGGFILYNASLNIGPKLNVFDVKNHTSVDLGVYGLPEKCTWSTDNIDVYCALPNTITGTEYPDYWYQGLVSFTDYFVKINTKTKNITTIANSQDEVPVDATNLFLNKGEDKLFFTNKKDSTLWSLDL
ncbi:MAG: hypothetical protein WCW65_01930 [Candidatus Paceibacterota bacterium]